MGLVPQQSPPRQSGCGQLAWGSNTRRLISAHSGSAGVTTRLIAGHAPWTRPQHKQEPIGHLRDESCLLSRVATRMAEGDFSPRPRLAWEDGASRGPFALRPRPGRAATVHRGAEGCGD